MYTHERRSRISLRHAWLSAFTILVIAVVLFRFIADFAIEKNRSETLAKTEIHEYREGMQDRIRDEVNTAIYLASFYLETEAETHTQEQIKTQIIHLLEAIKSEDVGYFFAADYAGNTIIGPAKGNNVYMIQDKNGLFVVQELIKAAQSGGGFVEYVMPPIDGIDQAPKLSYVLPFAPFGWYIGAGISLSRIEVIEKQISTSYRNRFISISLVNAFLALLLLAAVGYMNHFIYRRISREINSIKNYLEHAEHTDCDTDATSFSITELSVIASHSAHLVHALFSSMTSLSQSTKRFETMVRALPDHVFIIDREGRFLDCETPNEEQLLLSKSELIGKNIFEILPPDIAANCNRKINEACESEKPVELEYSLTTKNEVHWYEARFIPIDSNQLLILVRDVSELIEIRIKNEYLSYHDQLTGLYNRRFFEEEMNRLDVARNLPLSIVMIDVNGLKMINDAFGHAKGDILLSSVSALLKSECRTSEIIARTGGDEFVILLPQTIAEDTEGLIRRIYAALAKMPRTEWIVSISIGFATKKKSDEKIENVYAEAEKNMYRRKLAESQSMRNQTIQVIMRTLNEKNQREKIHSDRVSKICKKIGEAMGLDYVSVKELETAGLLHDIGKIVIDEKLLNKEGPLTESEFAEVRKHPEISYQILRAVDSYATIAEDILSHHERWDGTGYPRGIAGESISQTARIIAVADAYEAMTANRSYPRALSHAVALEEIERSAGTQFDPAIVEIFINLIFEPEKVDSMQTVN